MGRFQLNGSFAHQLGMQTGRSRFVKSMDSHVRNSQSAKTDLVE